jgi:hypothetical protein
VRFPNYVSYKVNVYAQRESSASPFGASGNSVRAWRNDFAADNTVLDKSLKQALHGIRLDSALHQSQMRVGNNAQLPLQSTGSQTLSQSRKVSEYLGLSQKFLAIIASQFVLDLRQQFSIGNSLSKVAEQSPNFFLSQSCH